MHLGKDDSFFAHPLKRFLEQKGGLNNSFLVLTRHPLLLQQLLVLLRPDRPSTHGNPDVIGHLRLRLSCYLRSDLLLLLNHCRVAVVAQQLSSDSEGLHVTVPLSSPAADRRPFFSCSPPLFSYTSLFILVPTRVDRPSCLSRPLWASARRESNSREYPSDAPADESVASTRHAAASSTPAGCLQSASSAWSYSAPRVAAPSLACP